MPQSVVFTICLKLFIHNVISMYSLNENMFGIGRKFNHHVSIHSCTLLIVSGLFLVLSWRLYKINLLCGCVQLILATGTQAMAFVVVIANIFDWLFSDKPFALIQKSMRKTQETTLLSDRSSSFSSFYEEFVELLLQQVYCMRCSQVFIKIDRLNTILNLW